MVKASSKKEKEKKNVDFTVVVTLLLLLSLGIIMVLSASSPTALAEDGDSYSYVKRQLIFAALGLAGMYIISKIDYRIYQKMYKPIYVFVVLLLLAVPIIGYDVAGAKRWIDVFGITSFQPSEVAKIGLIIFFAAYLVKYKDTLKKWWDKKTYNFPTGLIPTFFWLGIPCAILLFLQTHLSATLVIVAVISIMMIVAGAKLKHFIIIALVGGAAGGTLLYLLATYADIGTFRIARLTAFLDPWSDPQVTGWQIIQSLYAIGSGGLFGVGLGNSMQKYLYISEPHNDFIFAVVAEELGFIGCAIILLLFAVLIWRGIMIAINAKDMFGTLLAVGIISLISIQVIINIGVVTSVFPVTGMALPFFSYGGTSLFVLLCTMGILLNISRHTNKV